MEKKLSLLILALFFALLFSLSVNYFIAWCHTLLLTPCYWYTSIYTPYFLRSFAFTLVYFWKPFISKVNFSLRLQFILYISLLFYTISYYQECWFSSSDTIDAPFRRVGIEWVFTWLLVGKKARGLGYEWWVAFVGPVFLTHHNTILPSCWCRSCVVLLLSILEFPSRR